MFFSFDIESNFLSSLQFWLLEYFLCWNIFGMSFSLKLISFLISRIDFCIFFQKVTPVKPWHIKCGFVCKRTDSPNLIISAITTLHAAKNSLWNLHHVVFCLPSCHCFTRAGLDSAPHSYTRMSICKGPKSTVVPKK